VGFLDRLFGRDDGSQQYRRQGPVNYGRPGQDRPPVRSEDEIAIERYRYLLRTAPPETIEQVHAEAFAQLTPEQRRLVYEELKGGPEAPTGDDAASLARSATRSEFRQPGFLERRFSGGGYGGGGGVGGPGFGTILGGSLLGTVAGYVVGSALVSAFLPDPALGDYGGADAAGAADGGDGGDAGADGGDAGGGDYGDAGGGGWDTSDGGFFGGGDFGGGGFGGGDFGGGDFGGGDF
jgi:hypothetical protein